MKICWFSAGVSSFVACYISRDIDKIIYINIEDQHPDSIRFVLDAQKALGKQILILESNYKSVERVCTQFGFINGPYGAKCTDVLKKRVRKK